ncbi:MAG: hypothetical protein OEW35_01640 [Gammaproteobacteria bacterium]|nr:hypothetical protein [Gammaproteobacteria bacterium]MDH4252995.1 hypothetical protein [Gammaproteobacteria bacterium]MDH5308583.1 hypothetical protein [Gammaproteobacteria bacterium]
MNDDTANQEDESEMICGLTISERDLLRGKLAALPDTMPPRRAWQRIEEQARAEGLLRSGTGERLRRVGGIGIAAAVMLAVLNLPRGGDLPDKPPVASETVFPTVPAYSPDNDARQFDAINALMVQSRLLDQGLRSLPEQPQVVRAGTTAVIDELQDRIAAIDYQMNHPESPMTAVEQEVYWRERVRLMDSLLRLRYAQAQRVAF